MTAILRCAWTLLAATAISACLAGVARADGGVLTASLTPPAVALTPGGAAHVTLVISAGPAFAGSVVDVRPQPSESSVTVLPAGASATVEAGGSSVLDFTVVRTTEGSGQNVPVTFVVTSGSKPAQVATATFEATAAPSAALVAASIESDVASVDENRHGEAALVITNPRETILNVRALDVSAPDNVDVELTCPSGKELKVPAQATRTLTDCPLAVGPRSQAVMQVELAPADAVVPGPRSLLVKVDAFGPEGTAQSVVATLPFTVDVFAESDILKSIGVPVFLLLPGVIIVLTSWFLIRWVSPWRKPAGAAKLDSLGSVVSATTFIAVLSLAVSLFVARVYPWFTGTFVPGDARDYLKAYGFEDFYYVIGYSFVIAVVVWVCAWALYLVTPLLRKLFIPDVGDAPPDLLRKIGLRGFFGGKALFPRVQVGGTLALDLGGRDGKAFVVPLIDITLTPDAAALKDAIESESEENRAFGLWRTVRRAEHDGKATLSYRPGDIAGPEEVDRAQVAPTGSQMAIARVPPD